MPFSVVSPRSFVQIASGIDKSQSTMRVSLERLSSGLRINRSADDAAGLAISERLSAQVRGALASVQNMNMGTSLLQVVDGALNETQAGLMRMRELSVTSANETLTDLERRALNIEFKLLSAQLDTIAEQTNFNGIKLLDGGHRAIELQVGSSAEDVFRINMTKANANELGRQARYTTERRGVFVSDIQTGDMKINGVNIRATDETDDDLSYSYASGSSISKAKAINHATPFTGVRAIVGHNVIRGFEPIRAIELGPQSYFKINGFAITAIQVEAKDATGVLVDNINSSYDDTGVVANVDADGHLVLTAEDGRNITVEYGDGGVRDAMRMVDFNGDPINLIDTIDPVQYDLDGDIESVLFVGTGNYDGQHTVTGDVTINGVTTSDATGGYERPRDLVDYVLEVVKPGPIGVATFRYKEQSINDYINDAEPEDYLFNAKGVTTSQTPSQVSIDAASHYNEASDRTYTLTVTKSGLPVATNPADIPEFSYIVTNNDEASDIQDFSHLNIQAIQGTPVTLEHDVVIDFPTDPKSATDPNGAGNQTLNVGEDIRPSATVGTYNDRPKFVAWDGDRVTDFTYTVISAGHTAGADEIPGSNSGSAIIQVTAHVPSLSTTTSQNFTIDPTVGSWDHITFNDMTVRFFGRKGSTSESESITGSYSGTFESNDSVYVGPDSRRYVITMNQGGKVSAVSNLNATVSVQDSGGTQLSSHNIQVNSGTEIQLGTGVHFEGAVADFTASSTSVGPTSQLGGAPDIVNRFNDNYNGSTDETGNIEIVNSGRIGGSATYKYYYSGDDPNTPISTGNLNAGILTLGDGVKLNISSSAPPEFSSLNKNGLNISGEDASAYTEEQDGTFVASVQADGSGGQDLVIDWTLSDGTPSTTTVAVNGAAYVGNPINIGHGVNVTFGNVLNIGESFNGAVNANELDSSNSWSFNIEAGRVEVGDSFTVNASPRHLEVGDEWEVKGVVPEWNVGDVFVINADHNFIDQAPQVLTNTISLNDPVSGDTIMSTVNLTGAGSFDTGDEIRVKTRGYTGAVTSSGLYTDNLYPTNYIVTITKAGAIGVAEYDWVREDGRTLTQFGGAGSGVSSDSDTLLEEGVFINFSDNGSGDSYLAIGDQFVVPVGQKLEYTFAGEVTLQSDDLIEIEHTDLDAVNNFGRLIYDGSTPNEAGTDGNLLTGSLGANVEISVDDINILTVLGAEEAIDTIDEAIDQVGEARSNVGAAMNRLESRIQSTSVYMNELSRARQRIRDADIAIEVSELTRARTQQGAAPLLAQVAKLELQRALLLLDSVL